MHCLAGKTDKTGADRQALPGTKNWRAFGQRKVRLLFQRIGIRLGEFADLDFTSRCRYPFPRLQIPLRNWFKIAAKILLVGNISTTLSQLTSYQPA